MSQSESVNPYHKDQNHPLILFRVAPQQNLIRQKLMDHCAAKTSCMTMIKTKKIGTISELDLDRRKIWCFEHIF